MKIKKFTFNPFQVNTYVLISENECIVIDPGMSTIEEWKIFNEFIISNNLLIKYIVITHLHFDHYLGLYFLKNYEKYKLAYNSEDSYLLLFSKNIAQMYELEYTEPTLNIDLKDIKELEFGKVNLQIEKVPGHTKGHIALINHGLNMVFCGDLIFKNSIGRTDLPGGDFSIIINSIKSKIFMLPDETNIYPGHGEETTVGYEKINNPYL